VRAKQTEKEREADTADNESKKKKKKKFQIGKKKVWATHTTKGPCRWGIGAIRKRFSYGREPKMNKKIKQKRVRKNDEDVIAEKNKQEMCVDERNQPLT
jgi:hypothetical protein